MFRRILCVLPFVLILLSAPAFAQQAEREAEIKRQTPYAKMRSVFPGLTRTEYNQLVRKLAAEQVAKDARRAITPTPSYQPPAYDAPVYRPPAYRPPSRPSYSSPSPYSPSPYLVPPARSTPSPRSGTTYDWKTGNSYRWTKRPDGTTSVNGFNWNTGSTWRNTIKPDGSMKGTDSKFNHWIYNAKTKTYINHGTGQVCVGEGYARVCY